MLLGEGVVINNKEQEVELIKSWYIHKESTKSSVMLSLVSLHLAAEVWNSIMFILKATFEQLAEDCFQGNWFPWRVVIEFFYGLKYKVGVNHL